MSSIKQKLKLSLIIVIIIIILIALIFFIYEKSNYTLAEIEEILNTPKSITNMHILIEGISNNELTYTEIFMKDNFYYVTYRNNNTSPIFQECYYNPEISELVNVDREQEGILYTPETSIENLPFLTTSEDFDNSKNNYTNFEYLGKETVNDKKCLKICFTQEDEGIENYYIDPDNNIIVKHEVYSPNYSSGEIEKITDLTYTYSYNTLTDNDVKKFNVDDYPNYLLLN